MLHIESKIIVQKEQSKFIVKLTHSQKLKKQNIFNVLLFKLKSKCRLKHFYTFDL